MTEYRFEFKYILDPVTARKAELFIQRAGMSVDPAALDGFYLVTSLYFDNALQSDYYDKSGGFIHRKKLRARIYSYGSEGAGNVWLEIKKRYDSVVRKIRHKLSSSEWENFVSSPAGFLHAASSDAKQGLWPIVREMVLTNKKPEVLVRYSRRPYVGVFGGELVRITFDSRLEAHSVRAVGSRYGICRKPDLWYPSSWVGIERDRVIMEVKFKRSLPGWFLELIRFLELERVSISKYAKSVEAVRRYQEMPR